MDKQKLQEVKDRLAKATREIRETRLILDKESGPTVQRVQDVFCSVDVEAKGPIPGDNSMNSLGAAAFILTPGAEKPWKMIDTFEVNLLDLPGSVEDPSTMAWWAKQQEAWNYAMLNRLDPKEGMLKYRAWIEKQPGRPTFIGYPATFDFMFSHWYLVHFTGFPTPFSFAGDDIKSRASTMLRTPFRDTAKRDMPKDWFKGVPRHTHKAIDDAIGQGVLYMNMLVENL